MRNFLMNPFLNHNSAAQGQLHKGLQSLSLLALLFLLPLTGWGQDDYSGIYYIANKVYNGDHSGSTYWYNNLTPEERWYLVPAADPHQTNYEDAYYSADYSTTNGDPERPFLTTYQTNRDNNSIWIVKKISGSSKYYIIHALTGKYVKYEPPVSGNANRRSMHLETVEGNTPGNVFQYTITTKTEDGISGYNITPTQSNGSNVGGYLNPANDNWPYYYAHAQNNQNIWCKGLVGYYNNTGGGSLWPWEDASENLNPIIIPNPDDRTVTVSMPYGCEMFEIYYTTNGDTPTTSSTHATGSVTFSLPNGVSGTVKAKAGLAGILTTTTSELYVDFDTHVDLPTMSVVNCDNQVTLSHSSPEALIYYTLDGSNPTKASTLYTEPFYANSGTVVKFIAYVSYYHSDIGSQTVAYTSTQAPTITFNYATMKCVLDCPDVATIYCTYTTDGSEPADPVVGNSTQVYSDPIIIPLNVTFWIKAVAKNSSLNASCQREKKVTLTNVINDLSSLQSIEGSSDSYMLVADIDASGLASSISSFSGTFESLVKEDGTFYSINKLTTPLFASTNGATLRNLTFNDVNITSGTNVGVLVAEADGNTRIYNVGVLGGSVSGTGNVGGLVGLIKSGSNVRVVNCYSYANVSGGTNAAGIVGNNAGTVGDVRIALCMMYGNISAGATTISPVYTGNHINNVQNFTEYNFYLYSNERDANGDRIVKIPYTAYNDQQAISEEEYLTRFPFYRHILNTHRELGAFFLFGTSGETVNDIAAAEINEIGHWVVKKDIAPYPIVEHWDTNTKKVIEASTPSNILAEMGTNGYLGITVKIGDNTYTQNASGQTYKLPITDMDEANYDYTWGKVMLPYANEFEINTDYSQICTGWKITKVTKDGTDYTTSYFTDYNFADRDNPQKDIYSANNPYIFAQGGNYIVPYGVTAIEITANFATAYYLSDATYEVGYKNDYTEPTGLGGNVYNGGKFHERTVYNNIASALAEMVNFNTPHSQAIVLVGNYHFPTAYGTNPFSSSDYQKAFTLMSIDADNNQEPDYAWYSNSTLNRPRTPAMRFDFVAQIPVGMAAHVKGSNYYPGLPIWNPSGWFEMTETSLSWTNQFELGSVNFTYTGTENVNNYRLIINSGYFVQMVRSTKQNNESGSKCTKLSYAQIGGKAYIKEYYPGSHSARAYETKLVPVNVTGGEIEQCFMTGYGYNKDSGTYGTAKGDNIYFWCAGGKIGKFLGAFMEKVVPATTGGTVNMTAKIDHALIKEFYGGGTSPDAPVTGNIDVTIRNSKVDFYCGGPEFGDMTSGKTVTTTATNTIFGSYYGAGFGGTGIVYFNYEDISQKFATSGATTTFPNDCFKNHYYPGLVNPGRLAVKNGGIGTRYKFEYIMHSSINTYLVARFYTGYAKFDLATTGNVTNTLTDCTILHDFYGAGCQGKVNGTVTSTLTNCIVKGSAYGAGFKAEANDVEVYPTTDPKNAPYALPKYTMETGIFSDPKIPNPDTFQWKAGEAGTSSDEKKELYTDAPLTDLGNVTGKVTITVDGTTVVKGSVFGGGNESKVLNDTEVVIKDNTTIYGNVYGGGNEGKVNGHTTVIVNGKNVEP